MQIALVSWALTDNQRIGDWNLLIRGGDNASLNTMHSLKKKNHTEISIEV